jgi:hypothetical protein
LSPPSGCPQHACIALQGAYGGLMSHGMTLPLQLPGVVQLVEPFTQHVTFGGHAAMYGHAKRCIVDTGVAAVAAAAAAAAAGFGAGNTVAIVEADPAAADEQHDDQNQAHRSTVTRATQSACTNTPTRTT